MYKFAKKIDKPLKKQSMEKHFFIKSLIITITILVMCNVQVKAQNYRVTFKAEGVTTTLDSVKECTGALPRTGEVRNNHIRLCKSNQFI
jgi:hypothetical protein